MSTHLEVTHVGPGTYSVKAIQDHVVTRQRLAVDPDYLEASGIDGTVLVREVCDILLEHEALAAVPADSTVEQLAAHYPYLSSELHERLSTGRPGSPSIEPALITPQPAEDRPAHT